MAIKLAFSMGLAGGGTGGWDLATVTAKARVMGWAGVEIPVGVDGESPWLADPAALRKTLGDTGLAVACVATLIQLDGGEGAVREQGRRAIAKAADAGASCLRVLGWQLARGESRDSGIARVGGRLAELADAGTNAGVAVVVQNGGSFAMAKDLWLICEMAGPAGAGAGGGSGGGGAGRACWDLVAGMRAGEGPMLGVPTLNTRIGYARLWDAKAEAWDKAVRLGTGDAKCRAFVERLKGIGYAGWLSYAPPAPPTGAATSDVEADLAEAAKVLRSWVGLPELGPDGKVLPPKVEEKPSAKPAVPGKPAAAAKPAEAKPAPASAPGPAAATAPLSKA